MITLPQTLGQDFAYALGRLGTLEANLLKQTDIDRLLGAASSEEAVSMLQDIPLLTVDTEAEIFQDVLSDSLVAVKEYVLGALPENKHFIFDILWVQYDRPHIAFALKTEHAFTSEIAAEPKSVVSAGFAPELSQTFETPQEIDDAVAEACFSEMRSLAKRSGSKMIQKYVEDLIELEGVRTKMRTSDEVEMETIVFEKEVLGKLGEDLEEMKKNILGPEALFSYAVRALNQINLLKVLLTGKVNKLEIQEIKSLLPPLL